MTQNATRRSERAAARLARANEFLALLNAGLTRREIAARFQISDTRVGQLLALVLPPRQQPPQIVWTDELKVKLWHLWLSGMKTGDIGLQLGISRDAVIGKAHRMNLPPHAGRTGRKAA